MIPRLLTLSVALVGCKPAPDAPLSLEDGVTFLFSDFEGDAAELESAILDVETEIKGADLSADAKDRAFTLPKLTADKLGGATAPPGTDPNNQVATVLLGRSERSFDDNYDLALELNYVCIESDTTVFYGRTLVSGGDCWADRSCEYLRTTNEVRKENLLAKAWYDLFKDYRRVDLSDGRTAMIGRSWTEEVFPGDNGNTEFAQNFSVELWVPDGSSTLHAYAIWAEINIGLGADAMQTLIIDGLDQGFEFSDGFMAGTAPEDYGCPNDRDRAYDRPQ
ncbi:MAG TPA: hypothetical protein PKA64_03620 [Myxococcota bacterium]|nr:hypothetical protein [Myxococcota bacterium]